MSIESAETAVGHTSKLPPYSSLPEPLLSFDGGRNAARDPHPLRGLIAHGPFSRQSLPAFTPTIRIATVGPTSGQSAVNILVKSLLSRHQPKDRRDYVPAYPGFRSIFNTDIALATHSDAHISWPDDLEMLGIQGSPAERIAQILQSAISQLSIIRSEFDLVVVHLPKAWEEACRNRDFNAHDYLKAIAALANIPTQVVNDRTFDFSFLASRSWRLAIAFYVKAGGVPWKLAPLPGIPADTAYIGLAYALRRDTDKTRFVTCCSQVFDSDGGGMQFVAYEATDPIDDTESARRNPYLSRSDMRAVLARSLHTYQSRNGGAVPRRIVIHKLTGFTEDELAGATDALAAVPEVECVEITTNASWRGVWLLEPRAASQRSEPGAYPVIRGTMIPMSGTAALLWGSGNAPSVSAKGNFYQGGKSIPRPLLITRHAGSGPLEIAALETLALTKMDWNNDALYDPVPVTIRYSQRLAQIIANVPLLPNGEYPYRMFM